MIAGQTMITYLDASFDEIDAGGVIYHANYLKFCDRARNRILADLGMSYMSLMTNDFAFAVVQCNSTFRKSIRAHPIAVVTRLIKSTRRSITVRHAIYPVERKLEDFIDLGIEIDTLEGCFFNSETTLVACSLSKFTSISIPSEVAKLLRLDNAST